MSALHRVRGRNGYCGPSAIAAVLGISTDAAAAALRPIRYGAHRVEAANRRGGPAPAVKKVSDVELIITLNKLGCRLEVGQRGDRPTLRRWLDERPDDDANYIVCVRYHYIACNPANRTVVDRIFGGHREHLVFNGRRRDLGRTPRRLDDYPAELRQFVKSSYRIVPTD